MLFLQSLSFTFENQMKSPFPTLRQTFLLIAQSFPRGQQLANQPPSAELVRATANKPAKRPWLSSGRLAAAWSHEVADRRPLTGRVPSLRQHEWHDPTAVSGVQASQHHGAGSEGRHERHEEEERGKGRERGREKERDCSLSLERNE